MKGFRQLRLSDRLKLEQMIMAKKRVCDMARALGVTRQTIYNEKSRGTYTHTLTNLKEEERYSADLAQARYEENVRFRGTQLKIGNDIGFANYLETKIVDEGLSPEAVLGELKLKGNPFRTSICVNTLYSYISKGIFLRLSNKSLPIKGKRKRKYRKIQRQKRASAGTSIEKRDKSILTREEFGHWEMDSVIGRRRSKATFIVLTERKTRNEIVFKANDHSAEEVVRFIDLLEKKWGKMFPKVFKTITVDNGTEFAFTDRIEKGNRTKLYYCHAYCSSERGTNENNNRMIRRKAPKGMSFDEFTDEQVQAIEDWVNNYPRKIFGFKCARDMFIAEVNRLVHDSS